MKQCKKNVCLGMTKEKVSILLKEKNRYPDGYLDICKDCLKMVVNNYYFNSFIWVLEEVDVPFLYDEWVYFIKRYPDSYILGRYLSKMRLMGYRRMTFKDSFYRDDRIKEQFLLGIGERNNGT